MIVKKGKSGRVRRAKPLAARTRSAIYVRWPDDELPALKALEMWAAQRDLRLPEAMRKLAAAALKRQKIKRAGHRTSCNRTVALTP